MASIRERNGKFIVIYYYMDDTGKKKQKWETYDTEDEALAKKKLVEELAGCPVFTAPKCKSMDDLLKEYVKLYGKDKWALSTYESNVQLIANYITPIIGKSLLSDLNPRFLEAYYQRLLSTPAVVTRGKKKGSMVSTSTIRDIHKLLKSCFHQALRWEIMEKNPADHATVPKYKPKKREIWDANTLMYAIDVCENADLKMALNLAFAGSLRIGELLGLTWDCVEISEKAIAEGNAYIYVNKEIQRVKRSALKALDSKDVILIFPSESRANSTVRVMKAPKTESSVRRIYLPKSVAEMLVKRKKEQDEHKAFLGDEYQDFNLVMASSFGMPLGSGYIRTLLNNLIVEHNLPKVVFHSIRHSSVTYKLKLNGGDIKSVQGDSGHAQTDMITNVYSHIIDEDRRNNAALFEDAFYNKKNLDPKLTQEFPQRTVAVPEGIDPTLLSKILGNPEMMALIGALAASIKN